MDAVVAKLKKSATAEIHVALKVFNGRQYIDVREHFFGADDRVWHPTKKGIMLPTELLPAVIDGLVSLGGLSGSGTAATIGKSDRDEIRIGNREFSGRRYCELRTWYRDSGDGEFKPSNKGVTFGGEFVDRIVDALRAAEDQLRA